jgi:NAD(P)H dehydrogenase (quinone)
VLRENWDERRVVELEGPRRMTPNDIAATFSSLLGRPVRMEVVPRNTWAAFFRAQGTADPEPRMQMLDGFNEGWIEFEGGEAGSVKGTVPLEAVLRTLVDRTSSALGR